MINTRIDLGEADGTDLLLINPLYGAYGRKKRIFGKVYHLLEVAPPLGLLYVGANAIKAGYSVQLIDMEAEIVSFDELKKRLERIKPRAIGIACHTALLPTIKGMTKMLKSVTEAPIIIGGPHTVMDVDEIMEERRIDYCLRGESDATIAPLLDHLVNDRGLLGDINNLSYRDNGRVIHTKDSGYIANLDSVPFPARQLLKKDLYYNMFTETATATSIVTSRGCPYKCIYCAPIYTKERQRSVANVVAEIKQTVMRDNIRDFQFFDETFNLNPEWTIEFCNELVKQNIKIAWRARCRPDLFTPQVVKAMKKAGCRVISMGVESANDTTLKWFKKGYTRQQIETAMGLIADEGIELHGFFILGSPVETKEDMMNTIRLACKPQFKYASFFILTPLIGTKFYEMALEEGLFDLKDKDTSNFMSGYDTILKHPSMTSAEIKSLHRYAYRKFYLRLAPLFRLLKRVVTNPFLYLKVIQRMCREIRFSFT